jgi:hypothetical protein
MRKFIQALLIASVVLILILGAFQLAAGPVPMTKDPGVEPNVGWNGRPRQEPKVGWNGKEAGFIPGGEQEPNVGWNGRPAADIVAPVEVVCYDGFRINPMVGWNG